MSRNVESHFALNPTNLDIQRSKFTRDCTVKTTFNAGELIPFYVDEVLPGDTHQIKTSRVVRMQTLLTPMMDNLYLDTYYFFVPYRLVWDHWKEFMGENTQTKWIPRVEYRIPEVVPPLNGWNVGTIADYMGVPVGKEYFTISALPFRAYALICNEWFRDENLKDPAVITLGDTTTIGSNGSDYVVDLEKGGLPFKVAKYHDYFTSCLPAPQKGASVPLVGGDHLAVITSDDFIHYTDDLPPVRYRRANDSKFSAMYNTVLVHEGDIPEGGVSTLFQGVSSSALTGSYTEAGNGVYPTNLVTEPFMLGTINELRTAFQVQKFLERDARGGTRYIELIKSHFNVTSPDARMMRPEYLGGNRIPINVSQVVQQSSTDQTSPQGNVTGMSLTTDVHGDFVHSFTEHGIILGLMAVRYDHTYQQGLERFWSRRTRYDFYWPVFANIGEQAVLNREIFVDGLASGSKDSRVFGYQEAWADYRYKPSRVTGEMRSDASNSLDSWHLADDYETTPTLSGPWIDEDTDTVDRVLAISHSVSNQFFADVFVQNETTRPMPLYSVPGLIDHH